MVMMRMGDTVANIDQQCEENDLSEVSDLLIDDFYFPDCTELTKIRKSNKLLADFEVKGGDWKEILESYKDYFGDHLKSENQNLKRESANVSVELYEGSNA